MRYSGIIKNDFSAAPGVSVSFFTQGCPHRCAGCHNPETWDFSGGKEFTTDTLNEIVNAIADNGIQRSLSILGGEPLCPENEFLTFLVLKTVKDKYPNTKAYLWTGYTYHDLLTIRNTPKVKEILNLLDCIIDGPYIESQKDLTLPLRGSRNQNIIYLEKSEKI